LSTSTSKKPYQPPRLVAYGAVKDLTAGGSGPTSEYKLFMGNCTMFFNQKTKNTTVIC